MALLDETFAGADRDHWTERFDAFDVWWAPANTTADAIVDPQVLATGGVIDVPAGAASAAHRAINTPVDFGGQVTTPTGGVPALGEHSDEVLRA